MEENILLKGGESTKKRKVQKKTESTKKKRKVQGLLNGLGRYSVATQVPKNIVTTLTFFFILFH